MIGRFISLKSGQIDGLVRKVFCLCTFLLACIISVHAQKINPIDSIQQLIKSTSNEFKKIDLQNELAFLLYDNRDSLALQTAKMALEKSQKLYYAKGEKRALTLTGIGYYSLGDYPKAKQAFVQSTKVISETDDIENHYNQSFLATVYCDLGQFDSALYILQKTETEIKKSTKIRYLSRVYRIRAKVLIALWRTSEAITNLQLAEASLINNSGAVRSEIYYLYFTAYANAGEYVKAREYAEKVCEASNNEPSAYSETQCNFCKAELAIHDADYPKAIDYLFVSLQLTQTLGNLYARAQTYLRLAEVYEELSELNLAADFALQGLKISRKTGMQALTAELYATLGWISKDQKNYAKALEFTNEAELIRIKMKDKRGIANCYNTKGLVYMLQGNYALSIDYHNKALVIREEIKYKPGISASLFNLSLVYQEEGKYEEAMELQRKALKLDEEIGDISNLAISYNAISELLLKVNKKQDAKKYVDISLELAKKTKSKILLRNVFETYSAYYESTRNFEMANQYIKKAKALNDSLYNESMSRKLAEMNAIYDIDKKQKEIEILTKEKTIQETQLSIKDIKLKNQLIVIIIGSLVFIIVVIFSFMMIKTSRRIAKAKNMLAVANEEMAQANNELKKLNVQLQEKQEEIQAQAEELAESNATLLNLNNDVLEKQEELAAQAEELREANDAILNLNVKLEERVEQRTLQLKQAYLELDTFFYRSSHDFRRPITTFMGLAEVAKITLKETTALELFEKVNETALSLDKMIRKLQAISDVGALELQLKEVNLNDLIESVLTRYQEEAQGKHILLRHDSKEIVRLKSYPTLLTLIIENLVENAIQFAGVENPFVQVICGIKNNHVLLVVNDNGQGIHEEYVAKIYDMYFRANVSSRGNGLGLYIVRKAVDKINGSISVETVLHSGTKITVKIPHHS